MQNLTRKNGDALQRFISVLQLAKASDRTISWSPKLNKWQGVSGNRVLRHVRVPLHHGAAQGAAKDAHVPGFVPLMGVGVIVLYFVRDGVAVEAAGDKKPILEDFDSKVAARAEHGSYERPAVCFRAVGLGAS